MCGLCCRFVMWVSDRRRGDALLLLGSGVDKGIRSRVVLLCFLANGLKEALAPVRPTPDADLWELAGSVTATVVSVVEIGGGCRVVQVQKGGDTAFLHRGLSWAVTQRGASTPGDERAIAEPSVAQHRNEPRRTPKIANVTNITSPPAISHRTPLDPP